MEIIGARLQAAREDLGMSRAALAKIAGLTHSRIWQIETDGTANVNPHIVKAMAKGLRCSVEYLTGMPQGGGDHGKSV